MIWKVFFACSLGTFTMAMLDGILNGNYDDWSGAQIKFGSANSKTVNVIHAIPGGIIMGVVGGMLGSFFININTRANAYRKRFLKSKWMLPAETFMFCFVTATVWFYVPYSMKNCHN